MFYTTFYLPGYHTKFLLYLFIVAVYYYTVIMLSFFHVQKIAEYFLYFHIILRVEGREGNNEENLWRNGVCENKRHSKIWLGSNAIWASNCEIALVELTCPNMYLGSSRHCVDLYLLFLNESSLHWYKNQMGQNALFNVEDII